MFSAEVNFASHSSPIGKRTLRHETSQNMSYKNHVHFYESPAFTLLPKGGPIGPRLQVRSVFHCGQYCQSDVTPIIKSSYPQNADFPREYSKKERKPFPVPLLQLWRAARRRMKSLEGQPWRPPLPPENGLLVESLIPVAYEVLNARMLLLNNLKILLNVVSIHACLWCNHIHIGPVGHPFRSCRGHMAHARAGLHQWRKADISDIFLDVDAYHLYDRLGSRLSHNERLSVPRISAIVELCIQAGADLPNLPTKRRIRPVSTSATKEDHTDSNDKFGDTEWNDVVDINPLATKLVLNEVSDSEANPPSNPDELHLLSEATMQAWEKLRNGAAKLMNKYVVRVCGYCPEVFVGPRGHRVRNCSARKHQQRDGHHAWQDAILDDLIPPRYVWHVPDGCTLKPELKDFYGQVPAVVEICIQGGATVLEQYKSTMRLDIAIPSDAREIEMAV